MSYISITEEDRTGSEKVKYQSFAVVVPGRCAAEKGNCFDQNGIYECNSQADFEKNIGKVAGGAVDATAAQCTKLRDAGGDTSVDEYNVVLTTQEVLRYQNCIYNKIDDSTAVAGFLSDAGHRYVKVDPSSAAFIDTDPHVVIEPGREGNNVRANGENGNQIAYELLGLGYTVLYFDLESKTQTDTYENLLAPLLDKAAYDFRYLVTGNKHDADLQEVLAKIASARGDCTALIDIDPSVYAGKKQAEAVEGIKQATGTFNATIFDRYSALFAPEVTYDERYMKKDAEYDNNLTFPASFNYLACTARAINELKYNEWYAMAGETRGTSPYLIASASAKLGDIAAEELSPDADPAHQMTHAVNVITCVRNRYYLWSNRTAEVVPEEEFADGLPARYYLNIRQLCSTLKKELYTTCRSLTFEPNSDVLWITFVNKIRPLLDKMMADQGLRNYKIEKVANNKKATLTAKIRIDPIEAVDKFALEVSLESSISGTQVSVEEVTA